MSDFPWNLPEEWLPELPINRQLLSERYKELIAYFKDKRRDEIQVEIASVVKADPSKLSVMERGLLYQELLRTFGMDSGSGADPSGVPRRPVSPEGENGVSLPIPKTPSQDN